MAQTTGSGSIYFLIRGERIKVGFSTNVRNRLASMQHDEGDLLAKIEGATLSDEKAAHKYLWRWHYSGEWFRATRDCLDAVQELIDGALWDYAESERRLAHSAARMRSRVAAEISWANTEDRSARTAPARQALDQKFLDEAGGDVVRAEHLRKAHFQRMAIRSAEVRRQRRGA